jgi:hypothetical protein
MVDDIQLAMSLSRHPRDYSRGLAKAKMNEISAHWLWMIK